MSTILHLIPHAHLGGTEKDCLYIVEAGREYRHKVVVLGSDGPMMLQWQAAGAETAVLNTLDTAAAKLIASIRQVVDKERDIAGVMYWSTIKLPLVRRALKDTHARLAVHVGNPASFSRLALLKFHLSHIFFRSNIETALFCCSDYVRQSCLKNSYFRKFELRVSLNPVRLLASNPYISRELSVEDVPILGMTARLDPIKDHATVIRAFSLIMKEYPLAQLWLMGDGVLRPALEQLCADMQIGANVIFHGNVPNVYEYLQKLDVFAYATTPAEGLGNVVSEALANGLPCVVSDLPMMHEVAGSSASALFFSQADVTQLAQKVLHLLKDSEKRSIMSENAYFRAKEAFSRKRYLDERISFLFKK